MRGPNVRLAEEQQFSVYNFELADVSTLWKLFELHEQEGQRLLAMCQPNPDRPGAILPMLSFIIGSAMQSASSYCSLHYFRYTREANSEHHRFRAGAHFASAKLPCRRRALLWRSQWCSREWVGY